MKHSLALKTSIPDNKNLVKGIFALARQWKCFLAGTEKGEVAFYGSTSLKRRVVGRGVLTQRDRAILLREERASRQEDAPLNLNVGGVKGTETPVVNVNQSEEQGLFSTSSSIFLSTKCWAGRLGNILRHLGSVYRWITLSSR